MALDVNETVQSINDLTTKAAKMSEKWAKRNEAAGTFKGYIASHKEFLGKMSTVMSVVSVGFSVADSLKLFGEGKEEQMRSQLTRIEDKIDELKKDMYLQFQNISNQINYVSANRKVADAMDVLNTAIDDYNRYQTTLKSNTSVLAIESAKREFEKMNLSEIRTSIDRLYNSFFENEKSLNILVSIADYYKNSPEMLLTRGSDIIYKIQDGIQVICMLKRIEYEKLWQENKDKNGINSSGEFNLSQALEEINSAIMNDYFSTKKDVRKMIDKLSDVVQYASDTIDINIQEYFTAFIQSKIALQPVPPSAVCNELASFYPVMDFMVMKYNDCSGDDKHLSDYRSGKAITKFRHGGKNWVIFWDWRKELSEAQKADLRARATKDWDSKMETFGNMPTSVWMKMARSTNSTFYDIPTIIKNSTSYDTLTKATPSIDALLVKIEASSTLDWAHSSYATGRAFLKKGKNYWVAWFLLDIP